MSRVENNRHRDYSEFDNASTEMLQAFLEADFNAPEDERADVETIIYINKLLCEREDSETDVAAAKESFYQKYYPIEDDKFVFDFEEDNAAFESENKVVNIKNFRSSFLRYVAGVAAMFVVVLFGGTLTATAFGYNPWSAIAEWTDEVFWFNQVEADAVKNLQEAAIDLYGEIEVVPQWLPDGYREVELSAINDEWGKSIFASYCRLHNGVTEELFVNIKCCATNIQNSIYEKDSLEVVIYTVEDIDHYIMYNVNCRMIVWLNYNVECVISGQFSIDEAKKMIDSIYEE